MLEKDSKSFATIPDHILDDLSTGRPGIEITIQMIENLKSVQDIESIYLVPPFSANGLRNYEAAKELFTLIR